MISEQELSRMNTTRSAWCHAEMRRRNLSLDFVYEQCDPVFTHMWQRLLVALVLSLLTTATCVGNALIIAAILLVRSLKTACNLLILNLALTDFLVALIVLPMSTLRQIKGYWMLGNRMCDLFLVFDVLLCTSSILNLCAISIDRYLVISHPLKYVPLRNRKLMCVMIGLAWLASVLISILPFVGWMKTKQEPGHCEYSDDLLYQIYATTIAFYLPLIIMLILYGRIYCLAKAISRNEARVHRLSASNNTALPAVTAAACNPGSTTATANERDTACAAGEVSVAVEHGGESDMTLSGNHAAVAVVATVMSPSAISPTSTSITTIGSPSAAANQLIKHNNSSICKARSRPRPSYGNLAAARSRTGSFMGGGVGCGGAGSSNNPAMSPNTSLRSPKSPTASTITFKQPLLSPTKLSEPENSEPPDDADYEDNNANNNTANNGGNTAKHFDFSHAKHSNNTQRRESNRSTASNSLPRVTAAGDSGASESAANLNLDSPNQFLSLGQQVRRKISQGTVSIMRRSSRLWNGSRTTQQQRSKIHTETKAIKTLGVIMGCFTICWLPFFVMQILDPIFKIKQIQWKNTYTQIMFQVFTWLGYINSFLNPIIYVKFNREFRYPVTEIITCRCRALNLRIRSADYASKFGDLTGGETSTMGTMGRSMSTVQAIGAGPSRGSIALPGTSATRRASRIATATDNNNQNESAANLSIHVPSVKSTNNLENSSAANNKGIFKMNNLNKIESKMNIQIIIDSNSEH